ESTREFRNRAVACLDAIAQRHGGQTLVIVTHGLVLDVLYRTACSMALDAPRAFPLLNCSVNRFERHADGWRALAVCDVGHLAASEVTHFANAWVPAKAM